jgi:hypothetical protein
MIPTRPPRQECRDFVAARDSRPLRSLLFTFSKSEYTTAFTRAIVFWQRRRLTHVIGSTSPLYFAHE